MVGIMEMYLTCQPVACRLNQMQKQDWRHSRKVAQTQTQNNSVKGKKNLLKQQVHVILHGVVIK